MTTPPPLETLGPDPVAAFFRWFSEARKAGVPMHDSMALATATPDGVPSVRFVLLRPPDRTTTIAFFTNYESRKADELAANAFVSRLRRPSLACVVAAACCTAGTGDADVRRAITAPCTASCSP